MVLAYGKDFIGEDEPSPKRKETGAWVREQAAENRAKREKADQEWAAIDAAKVENERFAADLERRENIFKRLINRVWAVADSVAEIFGIRLSQKISAALDDLEAAVDEYNADLLAKTSPDSTTQSEPES
ncbi:hypothetical protein CLV80_113121 [Yoonia maritima]|uniref:Uncharacterized protein n=1 Tax=Yoonia maritima TaxID=1435347 RepID=A0A2T0VUZ5_9RHOB|nr:hypothetical protein [Yoonia maritima]PRY75311.1 hypothetical protein CLV80_113121 [Yoonia maritima]